MYPIMRLIFLCLQLHKIVEGVTGPGRYVAEGDLPWQVFISFEGTQDMCGGSIYNKFTIITAAHCLYSRSDHSKRHPLHGIRVFAGGIQQEAGLLRRASNTSHPGEYQHIPGGAFDIALIRLSQPLELDETIQPIPIAKEDTDYSSGNCTVSGFGLTSTNSKTGNLREVVVPLTDPKLCSSQYKKELWDSDGMICAGGVSTGSCQGDSGGPLVCRGKHELYGVVAGAPLSCSKTSMPGTYTSVAKYHEWIVHSAKELDVYV